MFIQKELIFTSIAIAFFFAAIIATSLLDKKSLIVNIFGAYGRNNGVATFIFQGLVLLSASLIYRFKSPKNFVKVLIIVGIINLFYSLGQTFGIDIFNLSNKYNPEIGFLGNPNFLSAFLGIVCSAIFPYLLSSTLSLFIRLVYIFTLVLSLFIMIRSESIQGPLIFSLSVLLSIYFKFIRSSRLRVKITFYVTSIFSISLVALGSFGRGPLEGFLAQNSTDYRLSYWIAGLRMGLESPITGLGLDSYINWYRTFRDDFSVQNARFDVVTDSAHNFLIDLFVGGGLILVIAYLLIISQVLLAAKKIFYKKRNYEPLQVSLFVAWVSFQVQSLISINHLGIAVWGWGLAGAIIGISVNESKSFSDSDNSHRRDRYKSPYEAPKVGFLIPLTGFTTGLLLIMTPLRQEVDFLNAIKARSLESIQKSANSVSWTDFHATYAAEIALANMKYDESILLARQAIEINPRSFGARRILISNPKLDTAFKKVLTGELKNLDPRFTPSQE